jgi:hypothetical protein
LYRLSGFLQRDWENKLLDISAYVSFIIAILCSKCGANDHIAKFVTYDDSFIRSDYHAIIATDPRSNRNAYNESDRSI